MSQIRTAAFVVTLVFGTIVFSVLMTPVAYFGDRATRWAAKVWANFALISLRTICGIRYRIEGAEHIPTGGAIVAANHQSMWETIALFAVLERPVMVFKKELAKVPIYGWWTLRAGAIPVDRAAGVRALNALTRTARARIADGGQVVVFPEGTRARIGEKLPLQPGIASIYLTAGAPCTPAVHDSGRFWRQPGGVTALKTPGLVTLRFLPPIAPGLSRKAFMETLAARLHGETPDGGETNHAGAEGAAA